MQKQQTVLNTEVRKNQLGECSLLQQHVKPTREYEITSFNNLQDVSKTTQALNLLTEYHKNKLDVVGNSAILTVGRKLFCLFWPI